MCLLEIDDLRAANSVQLAAVRYSGPCVRQVEKTNDPSRKMEFAEPQLRLTFSEKLADRSIVDAVAPKDGAPLELIHWERSGRFRVAPLIETAGFQPENRLKILTSRAQVGKRRIDRLNAASQSPQPGYPGVTACPSPHDPDIF